MRRYGASTGYRDMQTYGLVQSKNTRRCGRGALDTLGQVEQVEQAEVEAEAETGAG